MWTRKNTSRYLIMLLGLLFSLPVTAQEEKKFTIYSTGGFRLVADFLAAEKRDKKQLQVFLGQFTGFRETLTGDIAGWALDDSYGTLFITPNFEQRTFYLEYLPSEDKPIPAPVLASLIAKSEQVELYDADQVRLVLPARSGQRSTRRESLVVSLPEGALVRAGVTIQGF